MEIEQWFLNESVDEIADVSAEESQEITNNEGCTESINDFEDCQEDEECTNSFFCARLEQLDTIQLDTMDDATTSASDAGNNVSNWTGFKPVKDNINKNIHPNLQQKDHQTMSYHHCHAFAVKDCVDLSTCSDEKPDCSQMNPLCLLPNIDDFEKLKENFTILVSRLGLTKLYNYIISECLYSTWKHFTHRKRTFSGTYRVGILKK